MICASLLLADGAVQTTFEFGRIQSNTDWVLPILVCTGVMLFVRLVYFHDARELGPVLGWTLTALRTLVILGLLIFYLQPQWRSQREVVRNSRVLVLVDTSSSMGVTDVDASGVPEESSRFEQVAAALGGSDFLGKLRRMHDVVVLRFDEELDRVVSFDKLAPADPPAADRLAVSNSSGEADPGTESSAGGNEDVGNAEGDRKIDWEKALTPSGVETRLGQALGQLIYDERSSPVSGIVVFSDGGQNAGASPEAAAQAAGEAKIPIFTVGVGSTRQPANVRVSKLEAPPRAFPGDPFTVTGLIQTQGRADELAGKAVTVQLLRREGGQDAAGSEPGTGNLVDTEEVILGASGESVPVKFVLTPAETGLRTLCLRVRGALADLAPSDNFLETEVDVVDRKDRVLLLAGGPTREYRFLRTQLYRDSSMTVDVYLQTAQPGISQEADKILDDFPVTREEMFAYDCVVAFDPHWKSLSAAQIDLLETWVGEQGGGLIVIAGPVHTGEAIAGWVQDPAMSKVRALYPVEFHRRVSVWETETYVAEERWPLDFTREGLEAEFLWLDETASASQRAWAGFRGVYSHQPVRGAKSAATVYARFSDPRSGQGGQLPIFFAGQFYGSGRVFYIGSGEIWRLRRVDESHFERFYTRLIRHVSQGRLLRQSSRGVLMVGRDRYVLGNTVEIRAQLTDAQLSPLDVPGVDLDIFQPDGKVHSITMRPDPSRIGTYAGQLTVLEEGVYRLELPVPQTGDERITKRIQVKLPDLERQNPERDEKLLTRIARGSDGDYYDQLQAAVDVAGPDPLVGRLKDRTRTSILTAAPDRLWEESWMRWLMYVLCGLLCLEWLIRRVFKLA